MKESTGFEVYCYPQRPLTEEEKKLPCARFYTDYPMLKMNPILQQAIDAGPMDSADAIEAKNWLSLADIAFQGYRPVMFGYCMMPDGSGFYIEYSTSPATWQGKWRRWFGTWYNRYSRSMVPGQGNLRYKIWNPIDHTGTISLSTGKMIGTVSGLWKRWTSVKAGIRQRAFRRSLIA